MPVNEYSLQGQDVKTKWGHAVCFPFFDDATLCFRCEKELAEWQLCYDRLGDEDFLCATCMDEVLVSPALFIETVEDAD